MKNTIYGAGSFPFYFKQSEAANKFTDLLGFGHGFCRKHPSGLTFYIHRAKNKRDLCSIGITPILFSPDLESAKDLFEKKYEIKKNTYLDQNTYLVKMPNDKWLRFMEESFLKKLTDGLTDQETDSLTCNTFASLKAKDPQKSAKWYEDFLHTKTIPLGQNSLASVMKNGSNLFVLIHDLETNRKLIGPANYKLFGLKSKNMLDSWSYLNEKKKINPTWKWPKIDGPWRFVDISGPDGYTWRIYAKVNVYDIKTAADLVQVQPQILLDEVEKKKLDLLPEKYTSHIEDKDKSQYFYEDQLLHFFWKKSPYTTSLHFPNLSASPTHLALPLNLQQ